MNDEEFKVWAALKILELRKALDYDNSFFTTTQLDMLLSIEEKNQEKIHRSQSEKIVNLFP